MKFLFALMFLISTSAFAQNICEYQETFDFVEALKSQGVNKARKSTNHKRFTFVEKSMIHLTVTLQGWLGGLSRDEALENFADMYNGEMGSNAGEIVYYNYNGKSYALVHYWPGDNEFGAFFEMTGKAYKLVAEINDSFIECR